jgi:hypothetical protein
VDDWSQGLPLAYAQELCRSWAEDYDFGFAKRLNVFPQYRDTVEGLGIHFLHVRSPEPDAFPLVLTHGWPGSVLEFLEVLGPLTDPRARRGLGGGVPRGRAVAARVRQQLSVVASGARSVPRGRGGASRAQSARLTVVVVVPLKRPVDGPIRTQHPLGVVVNRPSVWPDR